MTAWAPVSVAPRHQPILLWMIGQEHNPAEPRPLVGEIKDDGVWDGYCTRPLAFFTHWAPVNPPG